MHRIAVLLLPPVVGFDAAIAPTMFSNASDADGNALYDVVTCALTPAPVASTNLLRELVATTPPRDRAIEIERARTRAWSRIKTRY